MFDAYQSIIFVHGLGSNPHTTWSKPSWEDGIKSHHIPWIEDLLLYDLPTARAWYFNYDSTVYNNAPQKSIGDIADELLLHLSAVERTRQIIFVAHSYGGLVVKEAVNRASCPNSTHAKLLPLVSGVVFLGTPHFGLKYAWHAEYLVHRLWMLHSNPQLHEQLRENSASLERQHTAFVEHTSHVMIANFFETKVTVIVGGVYGLPPWKVLLVPKMTATYTGLNVENHSLDTDHSGLNKHNSIEDPQYRKIVMVLRGIIAWGAMEV